MKRNYWLLATVFLLSTLYAQVGEWIRTNQLGYLSQSKKVAASMSEVPVEVNNYSLVDVFTGKTVRTFTSPRKTGPIGQMKSTYRPDLSTFDTPGTYYLKVGKAISPHFPINHRVYNGTADFLLNYTRQQRCGYSPFLKDSCHMHNGPIMYHPTKTGQHTDVRGGWYGVTDYLQYTTTLADATYQMMSAYLQSPEALGDAYDTAGHPGANDIPDIVDGIKWGPDWLNWMNPAQGEPHNQIADDRDHAGMRLPDKDPVDYGYGRGQGRPVYFCSDEPQVRGKFKNVTIGVASIIGKFVSCFTLGAKVLKDFYPDFTQEIASKADNTYQKGIKKPGPHQTASVKSPYICKEDSWMDDMELGAIELLKVTGDLKYLEQAVGYGRRELVTPWMGAGSARHYQWHPFMNMGHYWVAKASGSKCLRDESIRNLRTGIQRTYEKVVGSPFPYGIPYIWCSNNPTTAMLTQCRLYRELTGDTAYEEMEASLRDWLLGCNPWGTSMIVELPLSGDYPIQPHPSLLNVGVGNTTGGLVDSPVRRTIFENLRGVNMEGIPGTPGQDYERFQPDLMAYHDAFHDYSTNEPTIDRTACLTYYLFSLQKDGMKQANAVVDKNIYNNGGIICTDPSKKRTMFIFIVADRADGADIIISTLKKQGIKGALFFTGEFYELYPDVVQRLLKKGHYVGSHSHGYLLHSPWENRGSLLATREEFEKNLLKSYEMVRKAGIGSKDVPLCIPPYEYYNRQIAAWAKNMGIQVVNFTADTASNADYTTPDMKNRRSSQTIYDKILSVEAVEGLNGHLMLIHLGTDVRHTDKFYKGHLERSIKVLKNKGYKFVPL